MTTGLARPQGSSPLPKIWLMTPALPHAPAAEATLKKCYIQALPRISANLSILYVPLLAAVLLLLLLLLQPPQPLLLHKQLSLPLLLLHLPHLP